MSFKPRLQDEKEPALWRTRMYTVGRENSKHDAYEYRVLSQSHSPRACVAWRRNGVREGEGRPL